MLGPRLLALLLSLASATTPLLAPSTPDPAAVAAISFILLLLQGAPAVAGVLLSANEPCLDVC
jgi:hypothetical protein